MKNILVPLDFSAQSREALKVATDLAARVNGEVVLLHVISLSNLYTPGFAGEPLALDTSYFNRLEADVRQELNKVKKETDEKGLRSKIEVIYGDFIISVKNVIESNKSDLVVMGTSGASGLTEILIGSNTEKVVRFSPVPVLAVRKAVDLRSIKTILLPSALDLNQKAFIDRLKQLQSFFNATLHVLHVTTPTHFRRSRVVHEALGEFAKHYKLANYQLHFENYENEEDGILDFAYSEKMDLIAMATHARKGLAHLFNRSITEGVVNHIKTPVWTCHLRPEG